MGVIIPSVDLSGDMVVKRVRGTRGSELTRLGVDDALRIISGYPMVHIVDLDGAEAGRPVNLGAVARIAREFGGNCQVGGGIRSLSDAELVLGLCRRVVLGTVAVEEPEKLRAFIDHLGSGSIAVSLDVLDGWAMSRGWSRRVGRFQDVLSKLPRVGALVYTSIDVEGTGSGPRFPNVGPMREVADEVHYAGGVSDCNDVRGAWGAGFDGVIVGYALYVRGIRC